MPAPESDAARRSVVPQAAGRSLWFAAAWTGLGTALLAAMFGIVAVAVCWLPVSGLRGNGGSAVRAGVLTFLASLHGGITVDGVAAAFVPLGMTAAVALLAWRAGAGLADAAAELDEQRPGPLLAAGGVQLLVFAASCGLAARFCVLGSSAVAVGAAVLAGGVLFAFSGGLAFVRWSALGPLIAARLPGWAAPGLRAAAAATAVYVGCGALLVAASLVLHHQRVETLSHQVGGGWSGAPVLLLGVLAAPNAAIAGASYLAGPGFALGVGSDVSLGTAAHGTLPAFPVLGAVPTGPAGSAAWLLVTATPVAAGLAAVRVARAGGSWRARWAGLAAGVAGTALLGAILAALGGGGIGDGRLTAIGASPWQFGLAAAGGTAAVGVTSLAALAAVARIRGGRSAVSSTPPARLAAVRSVVTPAGDAAERDELAG